MGNPMPGAGFRSDTLTHRNCFMTSDATFIGAIRRDWFAQPRADILAGIVVALALIPEAIGFALIAGVDPSVGLYASVAIAMVIAFTGGRPGMISAATAAVAVVVAPETKLPYRSRAFGESAPRVSTARVSALSQNLGVSAAVAAAVFRRLAASCSGRRR